MRVDFMAEMGDRIPGTSGRALVEQYLGAVPDGFQFSPIRRRYPVIAARFEQCLRPVDRPAGSA
jgi:pyruvate,water dikinase